MEYRYLGKSGLRVSTMCLGTMNFGATTDEDTAREMVALARESGVNFIDTADAYVGGASETITGKLIKEDRANWVLATKVGQQDGPPERKMGLSKKWMMEAIDQSLQRLDTDYVDIYYMHHVDWETPLEESVSAMGEIIASGKAQYWGFSNHRAWQVGELVHLCDQLGCPPPIIAQPYYNIVNRQIETDLLPACEYYGIGVAPYSPLARGVLTGKYDPNADSPADSRAGRGDASILNRDFQNESFQMQPFIGFVHAPTQNLFHQLLLQWDFDVNGSDVVVPVGSPFSIGPTNEVSRLQNQSLMYIQGGLGAGSSDVAWTMTAIYTTEAIGLPM